MNVTKQLYQWDTGQKLTECTGIYVDYLIGDEVYRVEIIDGTCIIPDELLQTSGRYKVWECMADNTLREFAFKVLPRPVPPNYVFTPTEQLTFEGLVQKETNKFNTNAIEKLNAYNANADNRVAEFNAQTEQIQADVSELKSDLDNKNDLFESLAYGLLGHEYYKKTLELTDGLYNSTSSESNHREMINTQYGGVYAKYNISGGQKLKIRGYGYSGNQYSSYTIVSNDYTILDRDGINGTHEYVDIVVPDGAKYLYLNGYTHDDSRIYLYVYEEYVAINVVDYVENESNVRYDLDNAERRLKKAELNNDFAMKPMDKSYFAFVVDDLNGYYKPFYDIFHENNVPMSCGAIVDNLEKTWNAIDSTDTRIIKNVMKEMETNGGEVLAHYSGSLYDDTSDAEWLKCTRDVKKKLEQNGFDVRGIIRADNTPNATNKGEKYCRKYFDYSDGLGISYQYYNFRRTFIMDYQTMDSFKSWIDTKCLTNGFYPICLHGGRNDEPLATVSNLQEIISYILSKGGVITTYKHIFDTFGTTKQAKENARLQSELLKAEILTYPQINNIRNYKGADGIHKRIASVDLSELSFALDGDYYVCSLFGAKRPTTNNDVANVLATNSSYTLVPRNNIDHINDYALSTGGTLYFRTTEIPTGVIFYQLETEEVIN